jgi:hypothetical protein
MLDSPGKEITRRGFIAKIGQGLAVANITGTLFKDAGAQQLLVPDPPGKKLGWAIVGLGNLSINEILPAFAKCEKSKVVAFVSGHSDKANKLALRYGVNQSTRKTSTTTSTVIQLRTTSTWHSRPHGLEASCDGVSRRRALPKPDLSSVDRWPMLFEVVLGEGDRSMTRLVSRPYFSGDLHVSTGQPAPRTTL